ncbi:MAG: hypothetical protein UW37_C0004G0008 [Candidatus Gottesmanbacteria bacterium GW2011_GWA2_44_17]|uniref:Uncharacterized protein n=2 Tax=Candidatus Gottesmaniibacteriota TaxID=1752720 RepID=A0A0G1IQL2_9BACT|nr:MAG: seg [Microgenomates group bacterium GW2011_GWC1_43_11]KKT47717.1 MAG: hypothetical protein UW37_C0004G0008 [Candidatus Gottesmanbacteria bacterium GW2011_GWA2_44_17]KKT61445.1 MAG: hypothetical protein UW52_C0003G0008 [Candidatus Gottesmanbacteria bacterium GW2011_GWA1_44_24b]
MKLFSGWFTKIGLSKRQWFVLATVVLTVILILTQVVPSDYRYACVLALSFFTFVLTAVCLHEDVKGIEWITLLILPTLYSAAVALFYFLLPVRWLTRIPIALLYAFGFYALLLTENIYNVAANRTIALLRAAHSVGFLLSFVTYFLFVQTIFAFRFGPFPNIIGIGILSFILIFQSLWAMELEEKVSGRLVSTTIALTAVMIQLTWILSFWPVPRMMAALFIASVFYSLVGMAQQYLVEKMYKKTVIEFFLVCIIICAIFLATTRWRGI